MKVTTEHVGSERRGIITATIAAAQVGELRFVDYSGTVQINLIRVAEEHRHEGIATKLVAKLRAELPASLPAQFFMNDAARALHGAIAAEYEEPIK